MEPDAGLSRWVLAIVLFIGAHFSASYLVPLDAGVIDVAAEAAERRSEAPS